MRLGFVVARGASSGGGGPFSICRRAAGCVHGLLPGRLHRQKRSDRGVDRPAGHARCSLQLQQKCQVNNQYKSMLIVKLIHWSSLSFNRSRSSSPSSPPSPSSRQAVIYGQRCLYRRRLVPVLSAGTRWDHFGRRRAVPLRPQVCRQQFLSNC